MHNKIFSKLQASTSRARSTIESFSRNAPNKYKVYSIPKRTSGSRTIAHPSKELKYYQRALAIILRPILTVHIRAYAYRTGLSIKDNAAIHAKNKYLLKMDFNDFFNSITPVMFFKICDKRKIKFSASEQRLLTRMLFWNKSRSANEKLVLSVGAPTSPLVSNFTMSLFDFLLHDECLSRGITYSRYADDITFSTNHKGILFDIPLYVKAVLAERYDYGITINESKTVFSSKAHNRHITGITINNEGKLSLGRERKRVISSLVHQFKLNKLAIEDFAYLQGLLAFAQHIEPAFIIRLKNKYGESTVSNINKGLNI
ncbi:RNA-directed DNA polymerase [Vibrio parahaemolyticus]|nr:RNA-directed DNA polymerase [Vibrio parahaemolyticus]